MTKGCVKTIDKKKIAIDNNNIILRGCSLKNTRYIFGLVGYCGFSYYSQIYLYVN